MRFFNRPPATIYRSLLLLLAIFLLPGWEAGGMAQTQARNFGPEVSSYLLGLDEEMGELDFLLRRGEISRSDHARARARLMVTRRYVERAAIEMEEDRVPVLQVLAADELHAVGARAASSEQLIVGETFGGRWRLVAIEETPARYYVFEAVRVQRPLPAIDPREVIETIVIEEPATALPEMPAAPAETRPRVAPAATAEAPAAAAPPAGPKFDDPRVLRFYLPSYSREARARGIEGELIVSALLRRDGKIKDIAILQGLGHGLDERAREAVRRIEFAPALLEGRPVDARVEIAFNFRLLRITVHVRKAELAEEAEAEKD